MRQIRISNQITEGVIWKQILIFFFPILLGTFFQQLYNTADAIVVGKYVGKEALAAVGGPTGTLVNLLVGFFVGLSSGASVIIAQAYGSENAEATSRAVHTAAALALTAGLVMSVLGVAGARRALILMGTPADVMGPALTYLRIYMSGILFSLIFNVGSGILRAIGDSRRPLYLLMISTMVNVVLDLFFVIGLELGVAGAGIATVISQAVSATLVWLLLSRSHSIYRLEARRIAFDSAILRQILRIGLPAGVQSMMYSLANIAIQSTINGFGVDTVAAWATYGKIDGIFWMIMTAFGVAMTTFSGQNFGARKYSRIHRSVKVCLIMAMAVTLCVSFCIVYGGRLFYQVFTDDPQVIAIGMEIIAIQAPFLFTYVCVEILSGAARGTGDALVPMVLTCLGICVLRLCWIWMVVPVYHSLSTVIWSYPISWSTTSLFFLAYYFYGGWLKRSITKASRARREAMAH